MNAAEKAAFRAKYNRQKVNHDFVGNSNGTHDLPMAEAAKDINTILNDLSDSPARQKLRQKYMGTAAKVIFWIVADDVNALLDEVSPVELPESAESPPVIEEGKAVTT